MQSVIRIVRPQWFERERVNRKEAIALLSELGASQLVDLSFVILEQRNLEKFQLKIRGNYSLREIGLFLKNRFSIEESKNYLIIYNP